MHRCCQNCLYYGEYLTGGYTAAILSVIKKICHHVCKLFCNVNIRLTHLRQCVTDSSYHFCVQVFFCIAVCLYNSKLSFCPCHFCLLAKIQGSSKHS